MWKGIFKQNLRPNCHFWMFVYFNMWNQKILECLTAVVLFPSCWSITCYKIDYILNILSYCENNSLVNLTKYFHLKLTGALLLLLLYFEVYRKNSTFIKMWEGIIFWVVSLLMSGAWGSVNCIVGNLTYPGTRG